MLVLTKGRLSLFQNFRPSTGKNYHKSVKPVNSAKENSMKTEKGIIAWMINNRVTPNLLMIIFVLSGLLFSTQIKKEVFPAFELDQVSISTSYPGASPEEVEQGILLAVEEKLSGMEAIDELLATAGEGYGRVIAQLREGFEPNKVFQDIQAEVQRISTFPKDAEEPVITLDSFKREVLRLHIYGDLSYRLLRETAEDVKDRLLQDEGISQVEIVSAKDHEIDVAVPFETLRRYNLSHEQIAATIRAASIEIPSGTLDTSRGEILLRLKNRSDLAEEFATIPIISTPTGTTVRLGEIATVRESFEDLTRSTSFNGHLSTQLVIYRTGKETPIGVSDHTKAAMQEIEKSLSPHIQWKITNDHSDTYRDRLSLLLKNGLIGLLLVLLFLGLFLELRLAFWVTLGIPISFLGGMLFLPFFDVSINMISMFAFIIALGVVVDDAIIAGENIHEYRQRGMGNIQAAIAGAKDVALPVSFSILTNIVAFLPMAFVPGVQGKIWRVIPIVVISVFVISWIESLLILPTHLAHLRDRKFNTFTHRFETFQQKIRDGLHFFIQKIYLPSLRRIIDSRYLFIVFMIAVLLVSLSYVKSGRLRIILMPRVEADQAVVTATLPLGSPVTELQRVENMLFSSLQKVIAAHETPNLVENTTGLIDENIVRIRANLPPANLRTVNTTELTKLWRQETGPLPGVESLLFEADRGGPGGGAALSVELSHRDIAILNAASRALAMKLEDYPNVKDIDRGYAKGKLQYSYKVNDQGHSLGLSSTEVGRQLRSAWQGAIALRQQRGNNEVTIRVRLPEEERTKESSLENMQIRTPSGHWASFTDVTSVHKAPGYTTITRRDSRRTVTVHANVDPIAETQIILNSLHETTLPALVEEFPGLRWSFQGRQASLKESNHSLAVGFLFSLSCIYMLLAIPFRSYIQPLITMSAIPFGIIGAIYGHILMGYSLSLMSMMGMVALSGVVVNDSLVLIDYANKQKLSGKTSRTAVIRAGVRRFRPVLLTTITTFGGLAPMIFETSRQARFMIPMALSLGFGILFATVITLMLIPCLYLCFDDLREFGKRRREKQSIKEDHSEKIEALVRKLNS